MSFHFGLTEEFKPNWLSLSLSLSLVASFSFPFHFKYAFSDFFVVEDFDFGHILGPSVVT
jgi:hypothetical protein